MAYRNSPNWALLEKFVVPHYDDPNGEPYLVRWRLISTPWFGVFLHRLGTPDPRDTLHNHPWPFLSVILRGSYMEFVKSNVPGVYAESRLIKRLNYKGLNDWHWIASLDRVPTWTLMFVGRRRKVWGYLDRGGVVTPYDQHPFNEDYKSALAQFLADQGDAA